jgi:hypothetical protein
VYTGSYTADSDSQIIVLDNVVKKTIKQIKGDVMSTPCLPIPTNAQSHPLEIDHERGDYGAHDACGGKR